MHRTNNKLLRYQATTITVKQNGSMGAVKLLMYMITHMERNQMENLSIAISMASTTLCLGQLTYSCVVETSVQSAIRKAAACVHAHYIDSLILKRNSRCLSNLWVSTLLVTIPIMRPIFLNIMKTEANLKGGGSSVFWKSSHIMCLIIKHLTWVKANKTNSNSL